MAKWDAKKQFQSKVDGLKAKLQEKEKHIEVLDKQVTLGFEIYWNSFLGKDMYFHMRSYC